ncbi:MAG: hypothetical protein QOJ85_4690 [Solirubrobacteraceae bacterium]|jgi:hypothetical protein|nr:hypothetical protein [Solirubrobacteraceae bacterium]
MSQWRPEEARAAIEAQIEAYTTCLDVLDVYVDRDQIAVEFAVPDRPGCRFGFRWPVAGAPGTMDLAIHAMLARVNLEEFVEAADLTLPDCSPREISWLASR